MVTQEEAYLPYTDKPHKDVIIDLPPEVCFFKSAGDKAELVKILRP